MSSEHVLSALPTPVEAMSLDADPGDFPAAGVEIDEGTRFRSELHLALSQLRQKVCAEIAAVEGQLGLPPHHDAPDGIPRRRVDLCHEGRAQAGGDAGEAMSTAPASVADAAPRGAAETSSESSGSGRLAAGGDDAGEADGDGDLTNVGDAERAFGPVVPMARISSGLGWMHDTLNRERAYLSSRRKVESMSARLEAKPSKKTVRQRLRRVVRTQEYEGFFAVLIFVNSVFVAVEVEYRCRNHDKPLPWQFSAAIVTFGFVFWLELLCRIVGDGMAFYCTRESRCLALLDTIVVLCSTFEMLPILIDFSNSDEMGQFSDTNHFGGAGATGVIIVRAIRIARVLRGLRIVRLVRFMIHLRTLTLSISGTLKPIAWASVLTFFVMYVFGVTFTDCAYHALAADAEPSPKLMKLTKYWGSLGTSLMTLLQSIANGVSWRDAYEALNEISLLCGCLFLGYIAFMEFVLLNVITGVFCNSAIDSAHRNPDIIAQAIVKEGQAYMENLRKLFVALDPDSSGTITIIELETLLKNDVVRAKFQAMGLDMECAWTIFKLMDADGNGLITESEFVAGMKALKGGAKSADVTAMRDEITLANRVMSTRLNRVERLLRELVEESTERRAVPNGAAAGASNRDP